MKDVCTLSVWTVIVLSVAFAARAGAGVDEYELTWWTIDGGGAMRCVGGAFELSGTVGQADGGPGSSGMTGGAYSLTGGFWFTLAPTDCNSDGRVDLMDFDDFDACLSGPGGGLSLPDCNCFDIDADGDVDMTDAATFQTEFTNG